MKRRKSSTAYNAERLEAQRYANDVATREAGELFKYHGMEPLRSRIARPVWRHTWGVAFAGYLAGLRRKAPKLPRRRRKEASKQ